MNFHTHFWPVLGFLYLLVCMFRDDDELAMSDKLVFAVYLGSVAIVCAASSSFHLFMSVSEQWYFRLATCDYLGIALQVFSSAVPIITFGFHCSSLHFTSYFSVLGSMGVLGVVLSLHERFQTPKMRVLRGGVFIVMGAASYLPVVHMYFFNTAANHQHTPEGDAMLNRVAYDLTVVVLTFLLGAIFFVTRVPERFWPGRFDTCGGSHMMLHVCQVLASYYHFLACHDLLVYRNRFHECLGPDALMPSLS